MRDAPGPRTGQQSSEVTRLHPEASLAPLSLHSLTEQRGGRWDHPSGRVGGGRKLKWTSGAFLFPASLRPGLGCSELTWAGLELSPGTALTRAAPSGPWTAQWQEFQGHLRALGEVRTAEDASAVLGPWGRGCHADLF